jgi:hypothetical protein
MPSLLRSNLRSGMMGDLWKYKIKLIVVWRWLEEEKGETLPGRVLGHVDARGRHCLWQPSRSGLGRKWCRRRAWSRLWSASKPKSSPPLVLCLLNARRPPTEKKWPLRGMEDGSAHLPPHRTGCGHGFGGWQTREKKDNTQKALWAGGRRSSGLGKRESSTPVNFYSLLVNICSTLGNRQP